MTSEFIYNIKNIFSDEVGSVLLLIKYIIIEFLTNFAKTF